MSTKRDCRAALRSFHEMVRTLRREAPCAIPVSVCLRRTAGLWFGNTFGDHRGLRITISKNIETRADGARETTWAERADALLHEWAHALAWTPDHDNLPHHGPLWGVAYAACYQAVIED